MSFNFHSVKFKIGAAFGICILLMLCIGGAAVSGIKTLGDNANDMAQQNLMPIIYLSKVRADVIDIRLQLRRAQTYRTPAETEESLQRINRIQQDLQTNWDKYYPAGISSEQERQAASLVVKEIANFQKSVNTITEKMLANQFDDATELMEVQMTPIAATIERDASAIFDNNASQSEQALERNANTEKSILLSMLACIGAGLFFGVLASTFIVRTINKPLQNSIRVANQIADGRLENEIPDQAKDEFQHLFEALTRMDGQLSHIVKGIKTSSATIATASGEIAAGNMDLSSRTEAQASSLEETASAMEQLTSTVKNNSDSAHAASKLAQSASRIAVNGGSVVEEVITTMAAINESSKKIVDIISVIDGIAFQTNILALNAAVEAARAGEQGRGFAVVASEVRSLAQRSAAAAKEIKELIDDSVQRVDNGTALVANAGTTMREVVSSVTSVTEIVGEISAASQEQASGIEQVNRAIAQMDEVTQQNAALVEQAAAAAHSLNEQAAGLEQSVRVFSLRSEQERHLILEA